MNDTMFRCYDRMIRCYDRTGKPITSLSAWAEKQEDPDYKIVKQTELDNGKFVSTVWLGIDHQYGDGPPLIFETMVFLSKMDYQDLDMKRYSSEAEAVAGHKAKCQEWRKSGRKGK